MENNCQVFGGYFFCAGDFTPGWNGAEGRRAERDRALAGHGRPVFWSNAASVENLPRGGILAFYLK